MKTTAALFDCDGTLYSAQYGRGLMRYASERGWKGAVRRYYTSMVPLLALRKFKWIEEESIHRPLTSRMPWMIKGLSENEFRELSECIGTSKLITDFDGALSTCFHVDRYATIIFGTEYITTCEQC